MTTKTSSQAKPRKATAAAAPDPRPMYEALDERRRAGGYADVVAPKATHGPGNGPQGDPDEWSDLFGQRWQEAPEGQIVALAVGDLEPHPDNQPRTPEEVAAIAASMETPGIGQLEAIIVWQPAPDRYQIISGETRWRAAQQLGWQTVQCRIAVGITAAQALELLARYNGERSNLHPIAKALLISRLCQPVEQGGSGLTREQAGQRVGVKSRGAASNMVRLLDLPYDWQQRVAREELPWTLAREILPVVELPPVMAALEEAWQARDDEDDAFATRNELQSAIEHYTAHTCRRLNDGREFTRFDLDEADDAVRNKLGIVEFESGEEMVAYATNLEAFEAHLREQRQQQSKVQAEQSGADDPPAKAPLSEEAAHEKREQRATRRQELVRAWRHKLLRSELARLIDEQRDTGLAVVLAFACEPPYRGPGLTTCLRNLTPLNHIDTWGAVSRYRNDEEGTEIARLAMHLLELESTDPRHPIFAFEFIEQYAAALEVDVADAWQRLQSLPAGSHPEQMSDLFEEFLLLHQTDELAELADEWDVYLAPAMTGKQKIVQRLLGVPQGTSQRFPLPKCIAPLAGVVVKTSAAKGKKAAPAKVAAKKPSAGKLHKVNANGAVERPEQFPLSLPKASKATATIELARLADGWRFGIAVFSGEAGFSFSPMQKQQAYESRDAALLAGVEKAIDHFAVQLKRCPSDAQSARLRSALAALRTYRGELVGDAPAAKPTKTKGSKFRRPLLHGNQKKGAK